MNLKKHWWQVAVVTWIVSIFFTIVEIFIPSIFGIGILTAVISFIIQILVILFHFKAKIMSAILYMIANVVIAFFIALMIVPFVLIIAISSGSPEFMASILGKGIGIVINLPVRLLSAWLIWKKLKMK